MGCDGGVLAMQRKYMRNLGHKMSDKPTEEMNRRARALIRSRCCAASNELLTQPIVACELGNLFNKEAVLTALLERTLNPAFAHIRNLKDLVVCKFTPNPKYVEQQLLLQNGASESKGEAAAVQQLDEDSVAPYICPVTMVEMNARQPFVVVRTTGWVLSERAIKEIGLANLQEEYGPFEADDLIKIAPEEAEEEELRQRMKERRAKAKAEKKRKRAEEGPGEGALSKEERKEKRKEKEAAAAARAAQQHHAAKKSEGGDSTLGVKASSVALAAQQAVDKEMSSSAAYKSLFSSDKGPGKLDSNKLFIVSGAARYTIS